jgi:diguanylate cyclase (GGDEF)-like protein/PAS domain S-box-containing protein
MGHAVVVPVTAVQAPVARSHRPTRRWIPRALVTALVAGLVVLEILFPDGEFGEVIYLGVLLGAGGVAVWGAWRRPGPTRVPWLWIAAGVVLSGFGDLTFSIYTHVRGFEPDVSFADIPWLASYGAIVIGLLMLLRRSRRHDRSDVDGVIDVLVVAIVALLVIWQVSLEATVTDASLAVEVRAIWASYPILDAALLALVVRTAMSRAPGAVVLVGGVACWLFSDFFYLLFPDSTGWAGWLNAGWMVGAVLLAAATWSRRTTRIPSRSPDAVGPLRLGLAIAPLLVPPTIEVVTYRRGEDPNPWPLLIASLALGVLAFARSYRLLQAEQVAHDELEGAARHFGALVQRSSDAAMVLEPDGTIKYVSPAAQDQFGYEPSDLVGKVGWDLIHPDDVEATIAAFTGVGDEPGAHRTAELRIVDGLGRYRWVEEVVTNLLEEPAVNGLVANIRDISNRKAAEQQLERLAHVDELTGLPNRRRLAEQLREVLAADRRVALLVVDLDQFKVVNDSRSHAVGDLLLGAVAKRLRGLLRDGDLLGRTGGDEFGIVLQDVSDEAEARRWADQVEHVFDEPIDLHASGVFPMSAGIGIALSGRRTTAQQLLQRADTAMYAAKASGPGRTVVFDHQLRKLADEWVTVQAELRSALTNDELLVHYQPVVDLAEDRTTGVEALVRWRHPTRGLLYPADFIPIAERSDLIDRIGAFVLEHACRDAAWWARAGHPMTVAVNVSPTQLRDDRVCGLIRTALYDSGLPPELLVIEITETALIESAGSAMETLATIRSLGVHIALDDFGTGYSSLAFLKSLPADIVKIDRSFVVDIERSTPDRNIVGAVIQLATALDRIVVAEGVETEAQRDILLRLGCPRGQGFLWAPAVPAEQVLDAAVRHATPAGAPRRAGV